MFNPPPAGRLLPLDEDIAVLLRKHDKRPSLVVATMLWNE
jgi:hypothetical protein